MLNHVALQAAAALTFVCTCATLATPPLATVLDRLFINPGANWEGVRNQIECKAQAKLCQRLFGQPQQRRPFHYADVVRTMNSH